MYGLCDRLRARHGAEMREYRTDVPVDAVRRYAHLKAVRQKMCEELDLEDSLLATKPQLTSLALHSRATEEEIRSGTPMMEWQYGLWIPRILEKRP